MVCYNCILWLCEQFVNVWWKYNVSNMQLYYLNQITFHSLQSYLAYWYTNLIVSNRSIVCESFVKIQYLRHECLLIVYLKSQKRNIIIITCSHIWYLNKPKCVHWLDTHSVKVWWRYMLPNTNIVHFRLNLGSLFVEGTMGTLVYRKVNKKEQKVYKHTYYWKNFFSKSSTFNNKNLYSTLWLNTLLHLKIIRRLLEMRYNNESISAPMGSTLLLFETSNSVTMK